MLENIELNSLHPYHPECARSRLISEAKQGLVSTWMGIKQSSIYPQYPEQCQTYRRCSMKLY